MSRNIEFNKIKMIFGLFIILCLLKFNIHLSNKVLSLFNKKCVIRQSTFILNKKNFFKKALKKLDFLGKFTQINKALLLFNDKFKIMRNKQYGYFEAPRHF